MRYMIPEVVQSDILVQHNHRLIISTWVDETLITTGLNIGDFKGQTSVLSMDDFGIPIYLDHRRMHGSFEMTEA